MLIMDAGIVVSITMSTPFCLGFFYFFLFGFYDAGPAVVVDS
jgi:hypothetical protein